jgi:hypothetical protein
MLDVTSALKSDDTLGPMSHTDTVNQAFLNKRAQSRLKSARVLVFKMWKMLIPICCVL